MTAQIFLILSVTLVLAEGILNSHKVDDAQLDNRHEVKETVSVKLYYESLCPYCIAAYPSFPPLVEKLGANINLETYPFGNANITENNDGKVVVQCQHGEEECYGNKLHACAIEHLEHNVSAYINYNACLMSQKSTDLAADNCGKSQNIDSQPIKLCAKGRRGQELLKLYGNETEKVHLQGVPYVLINGTPMQDDADLMTVVCEAFVHPPEACNEIPNSAEESAVETENKNITLAYFR